METTDEKLFFHWAGAFEVGAVVAGGKGWNLGRLWRTGFSVPDGGVLAAHAYERFIEHNGLDETLRHVGQALAPENAASDESPVLLAALQEKIKRGIVPPPVREALAAYLDGAGLLSAPLAVRSSSPVEDSAGASFAGIHDSFLNVRGLDGVLAAVKGCYASLWSPRAVAYRQRMEVSSRGVSMAVVVQEMVDAAASGIAFSCDPHTGRRDILAINANYGLGESVVGGAADPDEYRLNAGTLMIEAMKIGRKEAMTRAAPEGGTALISSPGSTQKRVLTDDQTARLGRLVLRVHEALGRGEEHQDIEWVFDGRDFHLVQARPVTALPRYTYPALRSQPDIWSNANFKDAHPMVFSTLSWSSIKPILHLMLCEPLRVAGCALLPGAERVRLFQGRGYLNLSMVQWEHYDALGIKPSEINEGYGGHQPEIALPEDDGNPLTALKRIWRPLRLLVVATRVCGKADLLFGEVRGFVDSLLDGGFRGFGETEILRARETMVHKARKIFPRLHLMNMAAGLSLTILQRVLEKSFPGRGNRLANALLAGRGGITSAEHAYRLVELAEIVRTDPDAGRFFSEDDFSPLLWESRLPDHSPFKKMFRSFLEEYGHRAVYEGDIINPRWREDPTYLLTSVRSMIESADSAAVRDRQREVAERAWREIDAGASFPMRVFIGKLAGWTARGAALREMAKSVMIRFSEALRLLALETGRLFVEKGILERREDIFHCTWTEAVALLTGEWDGRGIDLLVGERKARREELEALAPPDLVYGGVPRFAKPEGEREGDTLTGLGVAAGRATGTARLVRHPHEGGRLSHAEVLVAPTTDAGWTPLFLKASAVVMETGGFLSHGVIVAREYGLPAVVNVPGVLQLLSHEPRVTVDGDAGEVSILSPDTTLRA